MIGTLLKCLQLKLMNVLLLMTVHGKLVSYFLLKVGEGPWEKALSPEVELWAPRMLCGGEPGEHGILPGRISMKCAKADWRWNAENNLLELREQEWGLAPCSGSLRILWVSASPFWSGTGVWGCPFPSLWLWAVSALSLRMSPFLSFFFPLPSFLPLFLSSLVFAVVVIKDTWMCFYLVF